MIRTMIQLTEEQMKALKELAKAKKTSVAKLVRESVTQYMTTTSLDVEERKRLLRRALEIVGKYHDIEGATDVAENHDKYLAEIDAT